MELCRATLALLDAALKDDPGAVAFASETCLPLARPGAVAALFAAGAPASRLRLTGRPDNGYAKDQQWAKVDRSVAAAHVAAGAGLLHLDARRGGAEGIALVRESLATKFLTSTMSRSGRRTSGCCCRGATRRLRR